MKCRTRFIALFHYRFFFQYNFCRIAVKQKNHMLHGNQDLTTYVTDNGTTDFFLQVQFKEPFGASKRNAYILYSDNKKIHQL